MRRSLHAILACFVVLSALVLPVPGAAAPAAAASPALQVAVVQSDIALNCTPDGSNRANNINRINGVVSLLRSSGMNVTVIGDTELASRATLHNYNAVVLVRDVATTEAQRLALRDYATAGGGVVSMFSASRYDYRPGYANPYKGTNAYGSNYWPFNYWWGFSASSYMSQAFEYGELSEMIATRFCNDPLFQPGYRMVNASSHPIVTMTEQDLGSSSISISGNTDYNETVWPVKGAPITTLLNYSDERVGDAKVGIESATTRYGAASHMAGWAMPYYCGKVVSYGFQLYDLLSQPAAAKLLIDSVKWAGSRDGYGSIVKTPDVNVKAWYSSGQIWANAGASNGGNIQIRGQLKVEYFKPGATSSFASCYIKDPNGWIPLSPTESYTDTAQRKPSVTPSSGRWVVRVSYRYFDYFRGGLVTVYRDGYLDGTGSGMIWRGQSALVGPTSALAAPSGSSELAGSDRYGTSVAISEAGWPSVDASSNAVVLASAWNFTDALAAASLAGKLHAPILLAHPSSPLPGSVANELSRLYASAPTTQPAQLYVVSSLAPSVMSAAESAIANAGAGGRPVDTTVLAGADCYATARNVAEAVGPTSAPGFGHTAFIVTSATYADALSVAPLAAREQVPILFVTAGTIPAATQQALDSLGVTRSIIIGSNLAVSDSVEAWLEANAHRGAADERLQGATRFDTCLRVLDFAKSAGGFSDDALFVATGTNFPDALALAPLAASRAKPVLLVNGDEIGYSSPSAGYLATKHGTGLPVTFIGSPLAVSSYVRGQVGTLLAP